MYAMLLKDRDNLTSGVFITFSGNCRVALDFYRNCFGGILHLETFNEELYRDPKRPVIVGSLASDRIIIHGSDLVHESGRRIGNHLSIFLPCQDNGERQELLKKLKSRKNTSFSTNYEEQKLIEVTDPFQVSWILSI